MKKALYSFVLLFFCAASHAQTSSMGLKGGVNIANIGEGIFTQSAVQ